MIKSPNIRGFFFQISNINDIIIIVIIGGGNHEH